MPSQPYPQEYCPHCEILVDGHLALKKHLASEHGMILRSTGFDIPRKAPPIARTVVE